MAKKNKRSGRGFGGGTINLGMVEEGGLELGTEYTFSMKTIPSSMIRHGAIVHANYETPDGRRRAEIQVIGCNHRGENPDFQIRVRQHVDGGTKEELSLMLIDGGYEGRVSRGSEIYVPINAFGSNRFFRHTFTVCYMDSSGSEIRYEARASEIRGKGKALVKLVRRLN